MTSLSGCHVTISNLCKSFLSLVLVASTTCPSQADDEHQEQVAVRAAAPPRPHIAEDRGAGMPRRRRRGMQAAMEARRPQRDPSEDGTLCRHLGLIVWHDRIILSVTEQIKTHLHQRDSQECRRFNQSFSALMFWLWTHHCCKNPVHVKTSYICINQGIFQIGDQLLMLLCDSMWFL